MNTTNCPTCGAPRRRSPKTNAIWCYECGKKRSTAWKAKHPDRSRALNRRSYKNNPHRVIQWRAQRVLIQKATPITIATLKRLFESFAGRCWYCHGSVRPLFRTLEPRGFDHKTPLSRGGKHEVENLVVCCWRCNVKKGRRTVEEFLPMLNQVAGQPIPDRPPNLKY